MFTKVTKALALAAIVCTLSGCETYSYAEYGGVKSATQILGAIIGQPNARCQTGDGKEFTAEATKRTTFDSREDRVPWTEYNVRKSANCVHNH